MVMRANLSGTIDRRDAMGAVVEFLLAPPVPGLYLDQSEGTLVYTTAKRDNNDAMEEEELWWWHHNGKRNVTMNCECVVDGWCRIMQKNGERGCVNEGEGNECIDGIH